MIIITGASSGIGYFLFEKFKENNYSIEGTYLNTAPTNKDCYTKVDVSSYEDVSKWIESLKLDEKIVLINAAGINSNEIFHKSQPENWNKVISANLNSVYNTCRKLIPVMRENKYGRIINISSVVAQKGVPGTGAYAASKSGLWGLTKNLAVENAKYNISVNTLNLGYFNTGMIKDIPEDMLNKIIDNIPAGRLGNPEEVYHAIEFLIKTPYVNGTTIDMNGAYF